MTHLELRQNRNCSRNCGPQAGAQDRLPPRHKAGTSPVGEVLTFRASGLPDTGN